MTISSFYVDSVKSSVHSPGYELSVHIYTYQYTAIQSSSFSSPVRAHFVCQLLLLQVHDKNKDKIKKTSSELFQL